MFTWDAFLYMYIGHGIRDGKDLPSIHRPLDGQLQGRSRKEECTVTMLVC